MARLDKARHGWRRLGTAGLGTTTPGALRAARHGAAPGSAEPGRDGTGLNRDRTGLNRDGTGLNRDGTGSALHRHHAGEAAAVPSRAVPCPAVPVPSAQCAGGSPAVPSWHPRVGAAPGPPVPLLCGWGRAPPGPATPALGTVVAGRQLPLLSWRPLSSPETPFFWGRGPPGAASFKPPLFHLMPPGTFPGAVQRLIHFPWHLPAKPVLRFLFLSHDLAGLGTGTASSSGPGEPAMGCAACSSHPNAGCPSAEAALSFSQEEPHG